MTTDDARRDREHWLAIARLVREAPDAREAVRRAMVFLHGHRRDYHWVGVYVLHGDMLVLGPYVGPPTDHVRIPIGRGVCGTAVAENQNQIVGDVRELTNYLACNLETRSEIVVLVREPETGRVLGQIDVDSRRVNAFGADEEAFLSRVAALLAPHCVNPAAFSGS